MPEPTRRARRPKNKNALLVAKTSLVALSVGLAVGGFGILAGSDAQTALQADALAAPDAPLSPAAAPTAIPTQPPARQERRQSRPTTPSQPAATPRPAATPTPSQLPKVQPQQPQVQPQQPQQPQVQPRQPQVQPQQPAARPQARTRSSR